MSSTSFIGLLFSFATGVALAFFYTFNKKVTRAGSPLQVIFWIFVAHLPPLAVWGFIDYPLHVSWDYFGPGLGVVALTIAGNLLVIRALSLSPLSLMMPVLCLSPVFTSMIGIPLLQEWPSPLQWLGIVLSVLGILWLYAPEDRPWDILSFWPGFFRERGAVCMAFAALCWSLSAPMDKLALRHADPAFHAMFVFSGLVLFLLLWLGARREFTAAPIPRSYWVPLAITGATGAAADILQLFALQHTSAGTYEAIKRVISQVIALLLAYLFFREPLTKPKMIGFVILSIGVPMIVL